MLAPPTDPTLRALQAHLDLNNGQAAVLGALIASPAVTRRNVMDALKAAGAKGESDDYLNSMVSQLRTLLRDEGVTLKTLRVENSPGHIPVLGWSIPPDGHAYLRDLAVQTLPEGPPRIAPQAWGLTAAQHVVFAVIYADGAGAATREQIKAAMSAAGYRGDGRKILDVHVCNIRKKLPEGITLETVAGGLRFMPTSLERLRAMIPQAAEALAR